MYFLNIVKFFTALVITRSDVIKGKAWKSDSTE